MSNRVGLGMKILHIGDRAGVAFTLAEITKENGHFSKVLFRPAHDRLGIWKKFSSDNEPYNGRVLKFLFHVIKVASKYDIIHSHIDVFVPFLKMIFPRKTIICHYHGTDLRKANIKKIKFVSMFSDKIAIATTDLINYVNRSKTLFIPNTFDKKFLASELGKREKIIFLPITLREDKNYMFSLNAWRILREKIPYVKLKIIKWGNDIAKCEEILKKDDRVVWLKPLSKDEMVREMKACSIVWEQHLVGVFGITGIEAMAAGVPVLTFFDKKNDKEGKYNPPVISPNNPREQAAITKNLIENENLRLEMGKKGQNWVQEFHSEKAVWKILRNLYNIH